MLGIRSRLELSLGFGFDTELPHESGNAVAPTAESLRVQVRMDSRCSIRPVAAMEDVEHLGLKLFIFAASMACRSLLPSIVAAAANIEQLAHAAYFESALVL